MSRRNQLNDETKPPPFMGWIRDRLYDTVFHVGDTTQEFLWDMFQGPNDARNQGYHSRILDSRHRRGQLPLTSTERLSFEKMMVRSEGERLTDYWRRKKALLDFPNKKALVSGFDALEKQKQKVSSQKESVAKLQELKRLEAEFRAIKNLKHTSTHKQGQK